MPRWKIHALHPASKKRTLCGIHKGAYTFIKAESITVFKALINADKCRNCKASVEKMSRDKSKKAVAKKKKVKHQYDAKDRPIHMVRGWHSKRTLCNRESKGSSCNLIDTYLREKSYAAGDYCKECRKVADPQPEKKPTKKTRKYPSLPTGIARHEKKCWEIADNNGETYSHLHRGACSPCFKKWHKEQDKFDKMAEVKKTPEEERLMRRQEAAVTTLRESIAKRREQIHYLTDEITGGSLDDESRSEWEIRRRALEDACIEMQLVLHQLTR